MKRSALPHSTAARTLERADFSWPAPERPGEPLFDHPVPPAVEQLLETCATRAWAPLREAPGLRWTSLQPLREGPVGRYRLSAGEATWFVRVTPRWGDPALEKALTDHLLEAGAPVNGAVVAGEPLVWNGRRLRLDIRPFLRARHFGGQTEDLTRVGEALRACHAALRGFPRANAVQASAAESTEALADVRDDAARALAAEQWAFFEEQADWARSHRDWLAAACEGWDSGGHEPDAQCLHGEVHPGNVCFLQDGRAILLDFEEATSRFFAPAWDLAFAFQRFGLHDDPASDVALRRREALAAGYGAALPPMTEVMRQQAWRSVMTLIHERRTAGVVAPTAEYDKFVRLEQQARRYARLP